MWDVELNIEGNPRTIKKFKEFAKSKDGKRILDFNRFIPYPNEKVEWFDAHLDLGILLFPEPIEFREKLEWRYKNWETCSNADTSYFEEEEYELTYYYSTGAGIGFPVIIEMSKQFPTLEFTINYNDEFGDCSGILLIENGEVLLDELDEIPFDLVEAELECMTEEDWRKLYEIELKHEK